jgi:sialidase-1
MMALKDGRLLLVYTQWYDGTGSDHDPARLVAIHSDDEGASWSEPRVIQENVGKMNVMSASLVRTADDKILLTYIRIDTNRLANLWAKESTDEGKTWSSPRAISHGRAGVIYTVNSAAIRLRSGRVVLAAYGSPSSWQKDEHYLAYSYYSDDEGVTWTKSANHVDCPLRGAMEPEIEQLADGRILMMIRTQTTKLYQAHSDDQGKTWSPATPTTVTHPEAPVQLQRIPGSSDLLLLWNNAVVPGADHQGPRRPLTMAVSRDNGRTWENLRNIEHSQSGSYSYATMAFLRNNIHLAYYGPGGLRYQKIPLRLALGR